MGLVEVPFLDAAMVMPRRWRDTSGDGHPKIL